MMNILLKRKDDTVLVVHLMADSIEHMRVANLNREVLKDKTDILARYNLLLGRPKTKSSEQEIGTLRKIIVAIEHVEFVRDNIGFDIQGHYQILMARAERSWEQAGRSSLARSEILDCDVVAFNCELPLDRTFRNAWCVPGETKDVTVDMPKARDIWRDRMRVARTPLLADLDVEFQRAIESGDPQRQQAIAEEKQELRDITDHPDIEAASTPQQLKACWPQCLGSN